MEWLIALALGLTAGLHTSTWGMFKDSPHEGFTWPKYFRSTILGGLIAIPAWKISGLTLTNPGHLVVFWGLVYVLERAFTEYYKTFLREEDQSKYFIPMQFSVGGRVVRSRKLRLGVAVAYLSGLILAVTGVYAAEAADFGIPRIAEVLIFGSLGGWISAFGGAWKDAPKEGFETLKFFRSPLMATSYALLMYLFVDDLVLITFPALGFTIASIETYKTFFFPSKPRGKFAGMPVHFPEMLEKRKPFAILYAAIWCEVAALIAWAAMSLPSLGFASA